MSKVSPAYDTQYGPPQPVLPGSSNVPPPPSYSTVVVAQPGVMPAAPGGIYHYTQHPALITCQFCSATVTTTTTFVTGTSTFVICFLLWLVGLGLGCCLIPFCMDGCKDVVHSCPNCKANVGRFTRM